ncbi:MAG: amidohydrolase family protein [Bacteroidetes bacterium]|nr:amidohydrolase family protein [Bacteroidota bacterium]
MKKVLISIIIITSAAMQAWSQDDIYPAPEYKGLLFITNATVHVGNGEVFNNATIAIDNGKIKQVGVSVPVPADDVKVINAAGKQVYPGLILPDCDLGLKEIATGVRGSNDYRELGDNNADIRSIVAYNTDSKIINTLKANGILLADIVPQGGTISGASSVVQLDAWNWEDAAYSIDGGIHVNMPSFSEPLSQNPAQVQNNSVIPEHMKQAIEKTAEIKSFFMQARAYLQDNNHDHVNLKFEAVKGLYNKTQKLFLHANEVKQMLAGIDFVKEFGFDVVIAGGRDSWLIADLLKQNNIAVILQAEHHLPDTEDDDIDQPYKTPAILQKAGVLFALNDDASTPRYRNLAFNAGTAAAYGLTSEEALSAITLNAAKILGIADKTGSIEVGKDANIIISEGDILDMKSSKVLYAFIQGRMVNLKNKQTQLYDKYMYKYGLK